MIGNARTVLVLALALGAIACGGSGDEGEGGAGGDAGGGSGGTGEAGTGGLPADPEPPVLDAAEARVTGRTGRDLRVTVQGTDPNGDVAMIRLRLLDGAGDEIPVVDVDGDDVPDSGALPAPLAVSVAGQETFNASSTLYRIYLRVPTVVSVAVRLVDAHGLESEEQIVEIATQPMRAAGEACDPAAVLDRCEDGQGCRGEPPLCQEGLAPEILRFAYVKTSDFPRILIEGAEPEDDLSMVRLGFLDSRGESMAVDLDGDDVTDGSSFEIDSSWLARDGAFFLEVEPMQGFDALVPQLSAVATDAGGRSSAAVQAKATKAPTRSRSQSCDPRGFDVCGSGLVCSPGLVGATNQCETLSRVRDLRIEAGPVLDPSLGHSLFVGYADGSSVYDAPVGCSTGDPTGRPEGIARLHLGVPAARLTLSTASWWTDFDTTVYLLPAEATTSASALGCGDDGPTGSASLLELANVPAGDYLVVVDSWNQGGSFELSVTAE
jgi:hypothetical protein